MDNKESKIDGLRRELSQKQLRREAISSALLIPGRTKDEVKALFDEGTDLDLEIEALEIQIRDLELPGHKPGEPINPWES